MTIPQVEFNPLNRSDGSATYADNLFTILAGANGPVEVQRRDGLPEEAAIEVNIRPLAGVSGPRERWLETILQSAIQSILLTKTFPRTLVQVTLQITKQPQRSLNSKEHVAAIPALFNAAFLSLLDAGLPLRTTATAALFGIDSAGSVQQEVSEKNISNCKSLHAMAYDTHNNLLFDESVGVFSVEEWDNLAVLAHKKCLSALTTTQPDEDEMVIDEAGGIPWMRQAAQDRDETFNSWRDSS
ncbi:hypothetical protein MRB53_037862 [Persea americana]|nr:hypothetical protein MRB53_037862 [Persea americana]